MARCMLAAAALLVLLAGADAGAQSMKPGDHPPPSKPKPEPVPDFGVLMRPPPEPPKHLSVVKTRTRSFGGPGGGDFESPCPVGSVMTGLRAREGSWIDAVAPICTHYDWARLTRGASAGQSLNGGSGGQRSEANCLPARGVIVKVEAVQADNHDGSVGTIAVSCGDVLDPARPVGLTPGSRARFGQSRRGAASLLSCPPPYVAGGIFGRSGVFVDRIGLLCVRYGYGTP